MANSCCFLVSQSLLPDYQRLLSSTPSRRLNPLKLIDNSGEFVFPHVANGFADTSAFLRELTLKSMLVLAPKVWQKDYFSPS
ncbi:hypothetical protein BHE74_00033567 [Ensete ventricosum]|nr:hypothetical protein GW17_00029897 [Ensete ventricosum]RWW59484.1 hypothetical protein BHE74_00033567 [Ensete ventricosum]RZS11455.1 hypothetical protein BHM03_00042786 [Ensete ventricosum]